MAAVAGAQRLQPLSTPLQVAGLTSCACKTINMLPHQLLTTTGCLVHAGTQILVMTLLIFVLALMGAFFPYNRGALLTSCVMLYAITAGAPRASRHRAQNPELDAHLLTSDCCMCGPHQRLKIDVCWLWIGADGMLAPPALPGVSGYVSGVQYKLFGGGSWVRNVLLTVGLCSSWTALTLERGRQLCHPCLLLYSISLETGSAPQSCMQASMWCAPLLVMFSFLNTVAIAYRSTAALPFGTIVIIILIWALVQFYLVPQF